jgi:outer membrane protein OmpA-like peptidoglycan-associated protein
MKTWHFCIALLLALGMLAMPAIAQDELQAVDTPPDEGMAAVEDYEPELAQTETQEAAMTGPDWWGNGAVSYRNYIPVAEVPCEGDCTYCDKNMICCRTGCPCANCQYICDDCDDCPPAVFDKIFFDLDQAVLRPESKVELDRVIAFMEANPGKMVLIEGHCCDWASDAYNLDLGRRRAQAAKEYLMRQGISGDRMLTQSYGEQRPWVGEEQRPLNRRAVIVVMPDGTR